jgi:hypothetical protein
MALDNPDKIDAIGIENDSGLAVLTVTDAWDWQDEQKHLVALQAKLNAYVNFVESGQIWESYPDAVGRHVVIDVVGKFPIPQAGIDLLRSVSEVCADFEVKIRNRHYEGSSRPASNQ